VQAGRGSAATSHLQLLQDAMHVILHGRRTDVQASGNLLVAQAVVDEGEHLLLRRVRRESPDAGRAVRAA
jgi:hypothetical protein